MKTLATQVFTIHYGEYVVDSLISKYDVVHSLLNYANKKGSYQLLAKRMCTRNTGLPPTALSLPRNYVSK